MFRKLTVEQNVLAILETLDLPAGAKRQRARELLAELNLTHLAAAPAYTRVSRAELGPLIDQWPLEGPQTVAVLFDKASTRTRIAESVDTVPATTRSAMSSWGVGSVTASMTGGVAGSGASSGSAAASWLRRSSSSASSRSSSATSGRSSWRRRRRSRSPRLRRGRDALEPESSDSGSPSVTELIGGKSTQPSPGYGESVQTSARRNWMWVSWAAWVKPRSAYRRRAGVLLDST